MPPRKFPRKGESNDFNRRYLASTQSGPFIREVSAHKEIAHTCLTYLMLTSFDPSMTEEEVDIAVLGGHYILQAYATNYWLDHVKEGIRGDGGSEDFKALSQKIMMFLARRTNQAFDRKAARDEDVLELKQFEKDQKRLYRELCYINSSLTTELSESLKASKKSSKPPQFRLPSTCAARKRCNSRVQKPETPKIPNRRTLLAL